MRCCVLTDFPAEEVALEIPIKGADDIAAEKGWPNEDSNVVCQLEGPILAVHKRWESLGFGYCMLRTVSCQAWRIPRRSRSISAWKRQSAWPQNPRRWAWISMAVTRLAWMAIADRDQPTGKPVSRSNRRASLASVAAVGADGSREVRRTWYARTSSRLDTLRSLLPDAGRCGAWVEGNAARAPIQRRSPKEGSGKNPSPRSEHLTRVTKRIWSIRLVSVTPW